MTVKELEIFPVRVNERGNWILTRITTSAGVTGIGDASHGGPDGAKIELLRKFFEVIKGRSMFDVERLRKAVEPEIERRGTVAAVALSGIEQCLWDIAGKLAGVPAADLFGGRLRTTFRCYANINRSTGDDRGPESFARLAEKSVAAGFDAIKLAPWDDLRRGAPVSEMQRIAKLGISRAEAVRRVIGPRRDLLLDAHSRFDVERGIELARAVEPLNLFWLEEVVPRPPEDLAAIDRAAKMPTAGGEAIYGIKGFYSYIKAGAVDIVMPDVKYCGGMLELKKIAALAEAAGLQVAPHGPASPVGNVAAAQVCASLPNFLILEHAFGEVPWRAELIDPPEQFVRGRLSISEKPGLGMSINEKIARRYAARS